MIRMTTGGVLRSYRRNLMNSFINQNKAMDTILTQRTFNSYAEDPASAAKTFRLRKSRMMVNSQHDICADTLKKYETAYSCLQSIDDVLDTKDGQYGQYMKTLKGTTLSMLNDPTGDAREQLTKVLDQMSEMLVQTMNQRYGDKFIFAGADGHNVPFEIVDGQLTYRDVPVDAAVPDVVTNNDGTKVTAVGGNYVPADAETLSKADYDAGVADGSLTAADYTSFNVRNAAGVTEQRYVRRDGTMTKADYDKACEDAKKLQYLSDEKLLVDIGLGFQENENDKLIESSAFDAALNGINFMGFGKDTDGDPKNLYSLVQRMKEVAESVPEAGKWDDATYDKFYGLVGKFETACSDFKTEFTNLAAGTTKLDTNEQLLKDNFYNLQEEYADLEDVEPVEAINNFLWAQYSYNAALKVGNSVLSQSLMDYLNT